MNRRKFLGFLGLGTAAAVVAPKLVSEEVVTSGLAQFGEAMTGLPPSITTTAHNGLLLPDEITREALKILESKVTWGMKQFAVRTEGDVFHV